MVWRVLEVFGLVRKLDLLNHELVPKHEVLSAEEKRKVLKELGIRAEMLPWIRSSDPIARIIGAKPGDVVKITRHSKTAGVFVAYRFVVP
ncbi:MAG: DNA-directed RNA polymerase subunit H [Thermoprotei archaeon]|nr:MAG: DNA-directed RNA polymerase subunit H [Thermoprotei archaeon]RLF18392.1 MAG: DNA-directed RNA polymerase subunit H [Thermoprotei archaeon]